MHRLTVWLAGMVAVAGVVLMAWAGHGPVQAGPQLPAPVVDDPLAAAPAAPRAVVLAGGCFWGVQGVYEHVRGVIDATAGYAGGDQADAEYETVSTGRTGHAESVRVTYDPSQVTLGALLRVFFSVVHDPTEWNRQGPDVGSQYRSVVFYANPGQWRIAKAYIAQLQKTGLFRRAIVTELTPLTAGRGFYPAEAYHQDYLLHHPEDLYIRINDLPKIAQLRAEWPELSRDRASAHLDGQ